MLKQQVFQLSELVKHTTVLRAETLAASGSKHSRRPKSFKKKFSLQRRRRLPIDLLVKFDEAIKTLGS